MCRIETLLLLVPVLVILSYTSRISRVKDPLNKWSMRSRLINSLPVRMDEEDRGIGVIVTREKNNTK